MSDEKETFSGFAVLELMGHRRLVGFLSEATIAGAAFIRIDVEDADGTPTTQFYAPSAVYAITPTTEAIARRAARTNSVAPISAWELREKPPTRPAMPSGPEQYDQDLEEEQEEAGWNPDYAPAPESEF
jgi:hypothetical protein